MAYSFEDLQQAYEMMSRDGQGSQVWLNRQAIADLLAAAGVDKPPRVTQALIFGADLIVCTEESVYVLRDNVLQQIPFQPFVAPTA